MSWSRLAREKPSAPCSRPKPRRLPRASSGSPITSRSPDGSDSTLERPRPCGPEARASAGRGQERGGEFDSRRSGRLPLAGRRRDRAWIGQLQRAGIPAHCRPGVERDRGELGYIDGGGIDHRITLYCSSRSRQILGKRIRTVEGTSSSRNSADDRPRSRVPRLLERLGRCSPTRSAKKCTAEVFCSFARSRSSSQSPGPARGPRSGPTLCPRCR